MIRTFQHIERPPGSKTDLVGVAQHASSILAAKTEGRYHWQGVGSLSFKCVLRGEARYKIKDRYLLAQQGNFLILNQRQPYEVFVESKFATETFCVFFGEPLVADVCFNLVHSHDELLTCENSTSGLLFFERTQPLSPYLGFSLRGLRLLMQSDYDEERTKELLHSFLFRLAADEYKTSAANTLHQVRKSTREELFKRVCIAKDYAHAMYREAVTLEKLARVACLSPNHLLRLFRQMFGATPIQYLKRVRMEKARQLLFETRLPVQEVCSEVGYSSVGTFSNHFKALTGFAPTHFRFRKKMG